MKNIFITGGGGYVGSMLTEELISNGYNVTIYDLMIYQVKNFIKNDKLKIIKGDLREKKLLEKSLKGQDVVIHLACISNDPSFDLNPDLSKSINLDSFEPLVKFSKNQGVKKFIYASSSSVYGIKDEQNVLETMDLKPLTDYSKYKAMCEDILLKYCSTDFISCILRPATVCGFSKRQRFDLVVNLLTNLGYNNNQITVFGGDQLRPNIHIKDMIEAYKQMIETNDNLINGEIFNVGYENQTVNEIAVNVKKILGDQISIIKQRSDDNRSYHISSEKIYNTIKFKPQHTIEDAILDLKISFDEKIFNDSLKNEEYFNIKKMQNLNII